jgi:hypothetical protein
MFGAQFCIANQNMDFCLKKTEKAVNPISCYSDRAMASLVVAPHAAAPQLLPWHLLPSWHILKKYVEKE